MSHRFELTRGDETSAVWLRLMKHFEERLAYLRAQNDKTQPEDKTENLRGRIAEIKELIAAGTPQPAEPQN